VDGSDDNGEWGFSDFAVLYRTGVQAAAFSDMFEKAGIPYQMVSRENHLSMKGIRDILSLFKLVSRRGTFADFERAALFLGKGVGKKTAARFGQACLDKGLSVNGVLLGDNSGVLQALGPSQQQKLEKYLHQISALEKGAAPLDIHQRLIYIYENIDKIASTIGRDARKKEIFSGLVKTAAQYTANPDGFFEAISLQEETDAYEFQDEKVALMTMHAAKGLEFPIVFIVGCEDGFIPYCRPGKGVQDLEEENRLFYVAMTRARERLYMTYAKKRTIYGKTSERALSPFVRYIEEGLRSHERARTKIKAPKQKEKHVQLDLF
jgi:superfamily I DNA/RNA helicase